VTSSRVHNIFLQVSGLLIITDGTNNGTNQPRDIATACWQAQYQLTMQTRRLQPLAELCHPDEPRSASTSTTAGKARTHAAMMPTCGKANLAALLSPRQQA